MFIPSEKKNLEEGCCVLSGLLFDYSLNLLAQLMHCQKQYYFSQNPQRFVKVIFLRSVIYTTTFK